MQSILGLNLVQILWALTFAALLVLLVVLLGRDRARRYPLFTANIILISFRLLTSRMLYGKLSPVAANFFFLGLALAAGCMNLAVVVELARRAFSGAARRAWWIASAILLVASGAMVAAWGPWPAWQTLHGGGMLSTLRLIQLLAQRSDMLADGLAIGLAILVLAAGRKYQAGWKSYTFGLLAGMAVSAAAQLAIRGVWQWIATHTVPHSMEEYQRLLNTQDNLYNANSGIYIAVVIGWIACLWREQSPAAVLPPDSGSVAGDEASAPQQNPDSSES